MELGDLEEYLHRQIPLSAAMQVAVRSATPDSVVLAAPLAPNINHKHTAFGGSVSALGILAAWSLVHLRLTAAGLRGEIVIQSNSMDYDRPIAGEFTAVSSLADPEAWPGFIRMLTRKKRARIEVRSALVHRGETVGRLTGRFVAFLESDAA
ncbi:thioesterase domain-containing protein [Novosphingobium sp. JCM 18896]|uniref:thioesterase domain-containing protein n=1 Tax=Novosphingobium sp. JCM 18896 TaxID=2989731 RepID=UPI0022214F70|nr:thioesterase domain-containing protein [Novosphingobium sp. JCM 18896]MCW1429431.1 thioesterase domain-containing protein [Novosphingobium sp. JCM 18896]